jgi:uncharacterized protein
MMTISSGLRRNIRAAAAGIFLVTAGIAQAQDATPEHLAAARAAIGAIGATNQFDGILPQAASALKAEMIQRDPNLEALITTTVDNEVLALAARRGDLEQEAARVYAKVFTEADLKAIADFYGTDVGKKLIKEGPIATRGIVDAANIWQTGVARDLAKNVAEKVAAAVAAQAPAPAAAGDGEPAPEAPKQ